MCLLERMSFCIFALQESDLATGLPLYSIKVYVLLYLQRAESHRGRMTNKTEQEVGLLDNQ